MWYWNLFSCCLIIQSLCTKHVKPETYNLQVTSPVQHKGPGPGSGFCNSPGWRSVVCAWRPSLGLDFKRRECLKIYILYSRIVSVPITILLLEYSLDKWYLTVHVYQYDFLHVLIDGFVWPCWKIMHSYSFGINKKNKRQSDK